MHSLQIGQKLLYSLQTWHLVELANAGALRLLLLRQAALIHLLFVGRN